MKRASASSELRRTVNWTLTNYFTLKCRDGLETKTSFGWSTCKAAEQTPVGAQCCRSTPLHRELHWLRVPQRIEFRLAVLNYRCLNSTSPKYLADALQRVFRHQLAQSAAFCVDGVTSRSPVESQNNRWSGLSHRCREGLEQSAAVDNVVALI